MTAWHEHPIVVLDFETSGVDPHETMPVQVGAVRFEAGEAVAKRAVLINPGIPIPPEATAIHGITDEMVKNAPLADEAIGELMPLVRGAQPAGYNAQKYDRVIWSRFHGEIGDWIDVIAMVRFSEPYARGSGRYKLVNVCERWGVPLENAHNAVGDAEATGRLLFCERMRRLLQDRTMEQLLEAQAKRLAEQEAEHQRFVEKIRKERANAIWPAAYAAAYANLYMSGADTSIFDAKAREIADAARKAFLAGGETGT